MDVNGYTSRIPGATAYTPNYQLHTRNSPRLAGLGDVTINTQTGQVTTTSAASGSTGILQTAENLISNNPLPVLILLGVLLLRR